MTRMTIDDHMKLDYRVIVTRDEDDGDYIALIQELPGLIASGTTIEETFLVLEELKEIWFEHALERGVVIPYPQHDRDDAHFFSGRFNVRLPRYLHRQLAELAEKQDTSLNQLVVAMLGESVGRWTGRVEAMAEQVYVKAESEPVLVHDEDEKKTYTTEDSQSTDI